MLPFFFHVVFFLFKLLCMCCLYSLVLRLSPCANEKLLFHTASDGKKLGGGGGLGTRLLCMQKYRILKTLTGSSIFFNNRAGSLQSSSTFLSVTRACLIPSLVLGKDCMGMSLLWHNIYRSQYSELHLSSSQQYAITDQKCDRESPGTYR